MAVKPNIVGAAYNFLDRLSIPYSKAYVETFLTEHKDYPSILCLSALLDDFNISNTNARVSFDRLMEINVPVIAFVNEGGIGSFQVIDGPKSNDFLTIIDSNADHIREKTSHFEQIWNGVLLLAQPDGNSQSKGNEEWIKRESAKKRRTLAAFMLLILALSSIFMSTTTLPSTTALLLCLKLVGAFTSSLILAKDLGVNSTLSEKLCRVGGNKIFSCEIVSKSKAAILFDTIRISEVSTLYFTGGLIFLIFEVGHILKGDLSFLYALTVIAFICTLFSLYYQIIVLKHICPLCIIIILTVWLELVTMSLLGDVMLTFQPSYPATLVVSFCIPAILWFMVIGMINEGVSAKRTVRRLKSFITSPGALREILQENEILLKGELSEKISINHNGTATVTIILSPHCVPCARAMKEVVRLASRYADLRFDIIVYTGANTHQFIRNLLEQKLQSGDAAAIGFLENWFSGTIQNIRPPKPYCTDARILKRIDEILIEWTHWLHENKITHTPTVYINKFLIPPTMGLADFEPLFRSLEKEQYQLA